MSARDLKPCFSLHYGGEPFPGEEDKNRLGYEPDAVYLKDSLNTEDVRDPVMKLFGETQRGIARLIPRKLRLSLQIPEQGRRPV